MKLTAKEIEEHLKSSGHTCWILKMRQTEYAPLRLLFTYQPRVNKNDPPNLEESIRVLRQQLEIWKKDPRAVFEITTKEIKSSSEANGDLYGPIEFVLSKEGTDLQGIPASQPPAPTYAAPGFETFQQYMNAMMEVQAERTKLAVDQATFEAYKEREKADIDRKNEALKELADKYTDEVGIAREGTGQALKHFIRIFATKGQKGLPGMEALAGVEPEAKVQPQTPEEQALDSLSDLILDNFETRREIDQLGVLVGRIVHNRELLPFYLQFTKPVYGHSNNTIQGQAPGGHAHQGAIRRGSEDHSTEPYSGGTDSTP